MKRERKNKARRAHGGLEALQYEKPYTTTIHRLGG